MFYKKRKDTETERDTNRECWVAVKAEIGVRHKPRNVRDFQQPPAARREVWNRLSLGASQGTNASDPLIPGFWPPELWENQFLLL